MSVKETVDSAVKTNKVTVFSKSYCPYCKKTKALFASKYPNVELKIFELDQLKDGSEIQNYLYEKTGQRTVPNVFIGEKHIGGNDDLHAAEDEGKIAPLLV